MSLHDTVSFIYVITDKLFNLQFWGIYIVKEIILVILVLLLLVGLFSLFDVRF